MDNAARTLALEIKGDSPQVKRNFDTTLAQDK